MDNFNIPRKIFAAPKYILPLPDLLEIQKKSYQLFLEKDIRELFEEISPIKDFIGRDLELHFLDYYFDEPKFSEITARERNLTYEAALRVKVQLVNKRAGQKKIQEVYLGDFPLMTKRGTFIINGIERVVVSQLMRSPGVFFTSELYGQRKYYGAKIIPDRGAWLELATDSNNVIWVKIDRKRKIAVTSLLKAFGYGTDEEIIKLTKDIEKDSQTSYIQETLKKDNTSSQEEGLIEVYKRIRPGDLAAVDNARSLIFAMFFNFKRYDLGKVGRYKFNQRFASSSDHQSIYGGELPITPKTRIFRKEDLICVVREIIRLNNTQENEDDIDHLSNRRIRGVGELVKNKLRLGLARMERIVKDRMSTLDIQTLAPNQLINARPVIGVLREFFMSSQLCQFMDQTNPLAELEHKRRISVMGPGGVSRERAGFEVRDVHRTFYGRICPIATPEGPNIGLIGHLASYASVNEYGFLTTPYFKVIKKVKNSFRKIQGEIAGEDIFSSQKKRKKIIVKKGEKIIPEKAKKIIKTDYEFIPIKPRVSSEVVYLTALEEEKCVITPATTQVDDKGYFVKERVEARIHGHPGFCNSEDIDYIDVSPQQLVSIATSLIPFLEHNDTNRALMGTNMQRQAVPCVRPKAPLVGTGVERKAAIDSGHLIISEDKGRIIRADSKEIWLLTKENRKKEIKKYKLKKFARSNASTCLNQKPLVEVNQEVKKGEILADGAATNHGELSLGQNLLVAFMPWGGWNYEDAIILSSEVLKKDLFSSVHIEDYTIDVRETKLGPELVTRDIPNISEEKLKNLDEEGIVRIGAEVKSGDILVGKITPKGEAELSPEEKLLRAIFGEKAKDVRDTSLYLERGGYGKVIGIKTFSRDQGDKLPAGVIRTIQITVACLRKIQAGDKFSGRHGNKGVLSKIVPVEDMPYLSDGRPIDIILNPLGVVSRMNLGQILETHLGLAAKTLGHKIAVPIFSGIPEEEIKKKLKEAGFMPDGKMKLFDGRTGQCFKEKVVVGYIYIMKLNHLVEDKIHQRSIGPYSLITQQPLGGKAQFGGQRFGEMEVWALEGYGAAHTLQEMLTIKSDDVSGRSKAYESIIKGQPIEKVNIPESFNVLVRELKGLALDVELIGKKSREKTREKK